MSGEIQTHEAQSAESIIWHGIETELYDTVRALGSTVAETHLALDLTELDEETRRRLRTAASHIAAHAQVLRDSFELVTEKAVEPPPSGNQDLFSTLLVTPTSHQNGHNGVNGEAKGTAPATTGIARVELPQLDGSETTISDDRIELSPPLLPEEQTDEAESISQGIEDDTSGITTPEDKREIKSEIEKLMSRLFTPLNLHCEVGDSPDVIIKKDNVLLIGEVEYDLDPMDIMAANILLSRRKINVEEVRRDLPEEMDQETYARFKASFHRVHNFFSHHLPESIMRDGQTRSTRFWVGPQVKFADVRPKDSSDGGDVPDFLAPVYG